jgi:predicted ribosomally synthesized peptide with nif11-like leader
LSRRACPRFRCEIEYVHSRKFDFIEVAMSQEQINSLVDRMSTDSAFAAVIAEAGTPLDVQRVAAEHGFDITLEEIAVALSARELSDAEL